MSWKTEMSRGGAVVLATALASGCLGTGSTVTSSATATEGSGGSEASDSATTTATTEGSHGMSSTSVGTATGTTGTTTTSTDTSTSADESTTTGCSFLCGPDGYRSPIECDIWKQDCDEGYKCTPWSNDGGGAWNATKCSPIDPNPDDVGEPCTVEESGVSGVDSCVKGAMCWNVDPETNTGVCVAHCSGSEQQCTYDPGSCCPPKHACTISGSGVLTLCIQTCDPILQDCINPIEVCYPVGNTFQCAPDVSGDMGAVGDPCEYINVCDPATFCGNPAAYPGCNPMAGGCCIPFCELDKPGTCVAGTECEPWYDPMDVPPGYENLGACVIPS